MVVNFGYIIWYKIFQNDDNFLEQKNEIDMLMEFFT